MEPNFKVAIAALKNELATLMEMQHKEKSPQARAALSSFAGCALDMLEVCYYSSPAERMYAITTTLQLAKLL